MPRRLISEDAAAYVRRKILDGELKPYSRVPQDEIAETLGISRIPLREALVILEREGWVTLEIHRGAYVNAINAQTMRDHYELYGILLGYAAKLAIERDASQLAKRLSELRNHFAEVTSPLEQWRIVVEFNRAVITSANSPRLRQVLKAMRGLPVEEEYFSRVESATEVQLREFDAIISAVIRRNPKKAAAAYGRVMEEAASQAIALFHSRWEVDGVEPALAPGSVTKVYDS
jgi:DNA-binding GntR family transcriptional regulator